MLKHRKRVLFVGVFAVLVLGLALILLPRNEPKYQDRYLSEWMEVLNKPNPTGDEVQAVRYAVKQIGTNGLPMFVAWMSAETPLWKESLQRKLPPQLGQNEAVANWLGRKDVLRAVLGMNGISIFWKPMLLVLFLR